MVRKLLKYNTDQFKKEFPELQNSSVEIYFDAENQKDFQKISEILLQAGAKKVKRIMAVILRNGITTISTNWKIKTLRQLN